MKLRNKVSIVTGGSMGVGKGIANGLAQEGSHLVLVARNRPELEVAQKELRKHGTEVEIFPADVTSEERIKSMVSLTLEQFGTIDVLVNCAGIYGPIGFVTEIDTQRWLDAINVNLGGTFISIKAVLPTMIKNKKGKIINLSGGGAAAPFPRFTAYSSSKAAVVRLTESLAQEVSEFNIDINAIAPGGVNTRLLDQALVAGEAAGKDFMAKVIKQKTEGGVAPERVAELAVFLASSESDGLSGKFISLLWDNWRQSPQYLNEIMSTDVYTLRRIIPKERGYDW
jgi:NAD(P)-dependent dehydrogenase (short-subunit alcohol dehydrogenase family)